MIGSPRLFAVKEVKERLKKNIDRCYNDPNYYQTQAGIDIVATTQDLLQQEIYQLWTDGRRILAYYTGDIQENRDEESLRLLKKIADPEIEDYPSHLLEQIRKRNPHTNNKDWQRGSYHQIHDEDKKRNPDADKKVLQHGSYHQNNDDVSNDGSNHDTNSDGSGH
ncbi:hypothetical protein Gotur_006235 [Gossypium turneri]